MFVLKAFATHSLFVNNTPGIVSPIGELSTNALTFAREKGVYRSSLSPDINLTTFTATIDGKPTVLSSDLVDQIVTIIKYVYDKSISVGGLVYRDEILQYLLTTYSATAFNFDAGIIVDNGTYFVPEWISFESKDTAIIGAGNTIRIWLSDPSFQLQYDDYEIVVIPPMDVLDNFFTPASNVRNLVNAFTASDIMSRIQTAKNNYPETIIRAETFNYIDPYNTSNIIPTVWNLLIYGAAGNNIDVIQNALITYILANSTHPRSEWVQLLPDIFKRTEFTIVPDWANYAIPNRTLVSGIYSPVINLTKALALINSTVQNYPTAHINDNTDITFTPYKSLALLIVGSPDNKNNAFKITDLFPDYIAVASTSADFDRMVLLTQNWVTMLAAMIIAAESMSKYSNIPPGMSKVTRNGILYAVNNYHNVDYLVAAKSSITTIA